MCPLSMDRCDNMTMCKIKKSTDSNTVRCLHGDSMDEDKNHGCTTFFMCDTGKDSHGYVNSINEIPLVVSSVNIYTWNNSVTFKSEDSFLYIDPFISAVFKPPASV